MASRSPRSAAAKPRRASSMLLSCMTQLWHRCYDMTVRVAALYVIHGNLPALEAVLADVDADLVVVGGDVGPGPQVAECLERLEALQVPVRWVMGNGDREVLQGGGGNAPDELAAWTAERLDDRQRRLLAGFEPTVELDVDGLGS